MAQSDNCKCVSQLSQLVIGFVVLAIAAIAAGCAGDLMDRTAVPATLVNQAAISNLPDVRFWGDGEPGDYQDLVQRRIGHVRKAFGPAVRKVNRTANILTLSGGGSDGAFGAGFLVGWTEHGTRPVFDFVTGISTGAMMAPFGFSRVEV